MSQDLLTVDACLRQWAAWSLHGGANIGWPATSLTARMLEWRELGIRPDPVANTVPEPSSQVIVVDRAVAKLTQLQRRAVFVYYMRSEPREVQARILKVNAGQLARLLERARWAIRMAIEMTDNRQAQGS